MELFRNARKKKNAEMTRIREYLLLLEDALGNIDLIKYIKNNAEALMTDENATLSIGDNFFTIKTPHVEFSVTVDASFTGFSTLESKDKVVQPLGANTTIKMLSIKNNFKETKESFLIEQSSGDSKTEKENTEYRAYLNDSLIFRRSKKHDSTISTNTYHTNRTTFDYYIFGEKAIKKEETFEMVGRFQEYDAIEDFLHTETKYSLLKPYDPRYFETPLCFIEPSGINITSAEFHKKLKSFRNRLARENAPKEFINTINNKT